MSITFACGRQRESLRDAKKSESAWELVEYETVRKSDKETPEYCPLIVANLSVHIKIQAPRTTKSKKIR